MKKNRYIILLISVPLILACSLTSASIAKPAPVATQTPGNALATVQPTPTPASIVIVAPVWLRSYGGDIKGAFAAGDTVSGWCVGDWCFVPGGKVWRGCTDRADGRGCQDTKEGNTQ